MNKWLVRKKAGKTILGPYTSLEVVEKLKAGEISSDDYVCEEGFATWITINKRKDITKISGIDTTEERRKTREKIDTETASDEIVLEETQLGMTKAPGLKSKTWIRWLSLALLTVLVIIVIRMQLTTPLGGGLSPAPAPKQAQMGTPAEDAVRSRRAAQPNSLDPNAVQQGVSRFTTINPMEMQEQKGGSLTEGEGFDKGDETRRRVKPKEDKKEDKNAKLDMGAPPPPPEEEFSRPPDRGAGDPEEMAPQELRGSEEPLSPQDRAGGGPEEP